MIDEETKQKFLEEVEKAGSIYFACRKVNIGRASYYRWTEEDKEFKKKAKAAIRNGRENNCDIAEYALRREVQNGNMHAIKYTLTHNSPYYKPKKQVSTVIMKHQSDRKEPEVEDILTVDDLEKISRGEYNIVSDEEAAALKAKREQERKKRRRY